MRPPLLRALPALLLFVSKSFATTRILHATEDRRYDDSWRPLNITSKAQLDELLRAEQPAMPDDHEVAHWLIALVADVVVEQGGKACGEAYEDWHLRSAHRHWPSRFLKLGQVLLSNVDGGVDQWREIVGATDAADPQAAEQSIHDNTCAVVLVAPGQSWSQRTLLYKLRSWEKGHRRNVISALQRATKMPGVVIWNTRPESVSVSYYKAESESTKTHSAQMVIEDLRPGRKFVTDTYIGHIFVVQRYQSDRADPRNLTDVLGFFAVSREQETFFITDDMLQSCASHLHENVLDDHVRNLIADPNFASENIGALLLQELVFALHLEKRVALSDVQIKSVPHYTKDGFRKSRVPQGAFERVRQWYLSNYDSLQLLERDGGPLYNHRHIPAIHSPLPSQMKRELFNELQEILEEWADGIALEGTSLYGVRSASSKLRTVDAWCDRHCSTQVRTYVNGSYLHLHVDTAETHVISGIINVDQDVDEPWYLEIFDLEGKLHAVNMEPGDLVLYESARLLHGRPHALRGRRYANLFVHYKPKEGYTASVL